MTAVALNYDLQTAQPKQKENVAADKTTILPQKNLQKTVKMTSKNQKVDLESHFMNSYYHCKNCDFKNKNPKRLISHLNSISDEPETCDFCGNTYCTKIGLKLHISRKHGVSKPKTKQEGFKCDSCASAFMTKFALTTHQKLMHKKTEKNHSTKNNVSEEIQRESHDTAEVEEIHDLDVIRY